ncbi:tripartite tricarboxylate transporter substrate binding protein [Variovorax sp. PCZ-1]|uniref:tripartite tricarboxylate transporter substrate binding protein n=1 Tax=Variovorax sp. PCZ-1 TaxID=2835533 RepID=UPI001BCF1F22|nr:tripartite tricarboxylate transporter substrate binding protein [Variovorax sp. PCZ-1]MBS7808934.1 tripartite tricarboxylate transporter substrate binding protein [Variovorax sp. PCZ-1]
MQNRRLALINTARAATVLIAFPQIARAQQNATKIIVPFAPGAGTDAVGRLVAQKLGEVLGTTVVVDNKTGAGGAIGAKFVADAAPDGQTLLLAAAPFTTVPAALANAGYDPVRQFAPVGMIASGPLVWAVNKDLPVSNMRDFVQLAKARPGFYNYGSAGAGGINHLVLEMLKNRAGVFVTHIPYRGIAPATMDMIGGQIHMVTGTVPALNPFIKDGRVKALAVTASKRSSALPDVQSMAEAGFAGFDVLNYFGLMAPKATPHATIERLNAALGKVVQLPDVRARFASDALEPVSSSNGSPAQLASFIEKDFSGWRQVVTAQNLKIDAA